MTTNGNGNGHAEDTRQKNHPAPELIEAYQHPAQYLIIVLQKIQEELFEALDHISHGVSRIYDMAIVRPHRYGADLTVGTNGADYARAINEYLKASDMKPLIDDSDIDHWIPAQMREMLLMATYQFRFDWNHNEVTWCRAKSMGIKWEKVLENYQELPTTHENPAA